MTFTLYENDISPKLTTKIRGNPTDKIEAHKQSQRSWYKRRGCYLNYRNRIARRLGMDITELKHLESVDALEKWASKYILETTGVEIREQAIPYIIYVIPKTPPNTSKPA